MGGGVFDGDVNTSYRKEKANKTILWRNARREGRK